MDPLEQGQRDVGDLADPDQLLLRDEHRDLVVEDGRLGGRGLGGDGEDLVGADSELAAFLGLGVDDEGVPGLPRGEVGEEGPDFCWCRVDVDGFLDFVHCGGGCVSGVV